MRTTEARVRDRLRRAAGSILIAIALFSVTLGLVVVTSGEGPSAPPAPSPLDPAAHAADDVEYVFSSIAAHVSGGASSQSFRYLTDFLPNVQADRGDARPPQEWFPTVGVIVGEVHNVTAGRAYDVRDDVDDQVQVPFDSDAADWRSVHFDLEVVESFDRSVPLGTQRVGVAIPGGTSAERFMQGLREIGSAVFALEQDSPVFAYDTGRVGIVGDGLLIIPVRANGTLAVPAMEAHDATELLTRSQTLAALRTMAAGKGGVVTVQRQSTSEAVVAERQG
jgi:hypothetical protein